MEQATEAAKSNSVDYQETPYQDASYPVIGDAPTHLKFTPMALNVIPGDQALTDVMFRDYGGVDTEGKESRWHLPEHVRQVEKVGAESKEEIERKEQEEQQRLIDEVSARAFEEGRQSALAESKNQFDEHAKQVNTRMTELLRDLTKQLQERIALIEKNSVQLSLDIVNKLVPHAVEMNPEYILTTIKEALGLAESAIIRQVRVSPEDKEFIDVVGLQKGLKEFDGTWEFVADETIRAGCVVDTSAGEVDYDLMKAWDRIKDNVMKVIK